MKKILLIIFIILCLYLSNTKEYNVSDESIRYRVIASSNSFKDIVMKEKVVYELSGILFKENQNLEEVNENIYSNLKNIEYKINKLFKENNYNKTFNISYGLNSFPDKVFLGKKYPSGTYNSLVIEIGEAKGDNYFCILYPSLCVIDYEKNIEKKEYGFKIKELINNIF